jgi:trk system potassium uptake protein TrkH
MTIARTICLGFIAVIAIGTLLLIMPVATATGEWGNLITALFTSTSAVCVTGLIVVDTGSYFSTWGQLCILGLIQIGGLGYMTTTTFLVLLIGRKFDLRQKIAIKESFDRPFLQGSKNLISSVFATTLIFEFLGAFFLFPIFAEDYNEKRALWLSIFHSISAWNNAGFGLFSDSLVRYQTSITLNLIITILVIIGGIGYQVIIEFYFWLKEILNFKSSRKYYFSLNFKVVVSTTMILLFLGTFALLITEYNNLQTMQSFNFKDKIVLSWFQSVITRTAGFNTIDISKMTLAGLFVSTGLMFVGASPSGTGGGLKTTTLRILWESTKAVLRGKHQVIVYEREVPPSLILKSIAVMFGSAMTVVFMTFLIALFNPEINSINILFEVVSAFATVGLSTGITAGLSTGSKLVLILTMYIGRVGVLLFMGAILGDPRPSRIQYPEENLLVG